MLLVGASANKYLALSVCFSVCGPRSVSLQFLVHLRPIHTHNQTEPPPNHPPRIPPTMESLWIGGFMLEWGNASSSIFIILHSHMGNVFPHAENPIDLLGECLRKRIPPKHIPPQTFPQKYVAFNDGQDVLPSETVAWRITSQRLSERSVFLILPSFIFLMKKCFGTHGFSKFVGCVIWAGLGSIWTSSTWRSSYLFVFLFD